MNARRILIEPTAGEYRVRFAGDERVTAGNTPDSALARFVRAHARELGIEIEYQSAANQEVEKKT